MQCWSFSSIMVKLRARCLLVGKVVASFVDLPYQS